MFDSSRSASDSARSRKFSTRTAVVRMVATISVTPDAASSFIARDRVGPRADDASADRDCAEAAAFVGEPNCVDGKWRMSRAGDPTRPS